MRAGERTGWRDQEISRRHRRWGFELTAVDLDFLLVEYHIGVPVALVEYKHHRATAVDLDHPTYQALRNLADRPPALPFVIARYWPDVWAFHVQPANNAAEHWLHGSADLSEAEWVGLLHHIRSVTAHETVMHNLNTQKPPKVA